MKSAFEFAEFISVMGSAFFLALFLEWVLLQGIFRALSAGLHPAADSGRRQIAPQATRNPKLVNF
jgi:hypothetical protein